MFLLLFVAIVVLGVSLFVQVSALLHCPVGVVVFVVVFCVIDPLSAYRDFFFKHAKSWFRCRLFYCCVDWSACWCSRLWSWS